MFKLFKWVAGTALAGALGLYLVFGTSAPSYLGTALGAARRTVKEAIPIQFEIRRSERLIREIDPQIHSCLRDVAAGEVELEDLQEDIVLLERRKKDLEARVLRRKRLLESDRAVYYVAGLRMGREKVVRDLGRVFEEYKNCVSLLQGKRRLLEGQKRALEAARRKLSAVLAERARLKDMLKSLKAQKRQVDALAAQSRKFDLDDSALVQAREALKEVKKRLDVAQKMLEADFLDMDVLEPREEGAGKTEEILAEVDRWFSGGRKEPSCRTAEERIRKLKGRAGKKEEDVRSPGRRNCPGKGAFLLDTHPRD